MKSTIYITHENVFLEHHRVHGHRIFPGLAYIDIAYQLFRDHGISHDRIELSKLLIYRPLVVDQERPVRLQVVGVQKDEGHWLLRIEGQAVRRQSDASSEVFTYASAEIRQVPPIRFDELLDPTSIVALTEPVLPLEAVYRRLTARGLVHSGLMKTQGAIHTHADARIIEVSLPPEMPAFADDFMFHPALVDGAAIGAVACVETAWDSAHDDTAAQLSDQHAPLLLPLTYDRFRASECLSHRCLARVAKETVKRHGEILRLDLDFFNPQGIKIAALSGLTVKRVRDAQMIDPARQATAVAGKPMHPADDAVIGTPVVAAPNSAGQVVTQAIAAILDCAAEDVDMQAEFYDLGLNSSGLLQVVSALEERLAVQLSPTLLFEHTNAAALAGYLGQAHADRFERQVRLECQSTQQEPNTSAIDTTSKSDDGIADIAVIGMSGRYPGAENLHAFWVNLKAGLCSVTSIPADRWQWQEFEGIYANSGRPLPTTGGFIDDVDCFDAPFFKLSPGAAEAMDPQERFFLEACWEALEDAGYTPESIVASAGPEQRRAVGVFVGVTHNDYVFVAADADRYGHPQSPCRGFASIASRVSHFCDFHGPSLAVDSACSASLTALHLALDSLRKGESEVALAGGVNLFLHPNTYLSYGMQHIPDTGSEGMDGNVVAEGVGALLLKPLKRAVADGDHIYAVIKASAVDHGGRADSLHVSNPVAQANAVARCLQHSGVDARAVTYLEVNGAGTLPGDPIDLQGLVDAFRRFSADTHFCALGSVRSNIGHAEAAAGIGGLTKVILQLHYKTLVPSLESTPSNRSVDLTDSPFYIQKGAEPWHRSVSTDAPQGQRAPRRACVSAFGATGSNAHVIVEEYLAKAADATSTLDGPAMIVLSARNRGRLHAYAQRLLTHLQAMVPPSTRAEEQRLLADLSYTLQVGRRALPERIACLADSVAGLISTLGAFVEDAHAVGALYRGRVQATDDVANSPDQISADSAARWLRAGDHAALVKAWAAGFDVPWAALWGARRPRRISLPTYPFARERYWIGSARVVAVTPTVMSEPARAPAVASTPVDSPGGATRSAKLQWRNLAGQVGADQARAEPDDGRLINCRAATGATSPLADAAARQRSTERRIFPLSEGQKGLWALQRRFPEMSAYNVPLCFRARALDISRFEQACRFVLDQHPVLTAIIERSDTTLRGVTRPDRRLDISQANLRGLGPDQMQAALAQAAKRAFDLERDPPFRVCLFSLSQQETIVLLCMHHIVFDGHSIPILLRTLFSAYRDIGRDLTPKRFLASFDYGDFAREEAALLASEQGARRLSYWQEQLVAPLPVLALPGKVCAATADAFAGASHRQVLSADLSLQIRRFCDAHRIYASTLLLGLFNIVLARYTGEDDVIVGMAINQRKSSRFQQAVDFLVNILPIRSQLDETQALDIYLRGLQKTMIQAMAHDYPLAALVRTLCASDATVASPIFQAVFMFQDMLKDMRCWEPEFCWMDEIRQEGEYPLVLEASEDADRFVLCWKFQSALHEVDTIRRMAEHYAQLADVVLRVPDRPLSAQSLLSADEERLLLRDWNATTTAYPKHETVDSLFQAQVHATPTAIALVCGHRSLRYAELSDRVSALAIRLRRRSLEPHGRVAVCIERSIDMVVGLLAVLRAGMTYVPLDPSFPEDRLGYILHDSRAAIVLTQASLRAKVARLLEARGKTDASAPVRIVVPDNDDESDTIGFESETGAFEAVRLSPIELHEPLDLAYIIYTSGSTGRPKGVVITHRALTNFLLSMAKAPGMGRDDRLLAVTTYSFDIAALELFLPLIVGGQCHVAESGVVQQAEHLKALIGQTRPTVMQATPSTWSMLFHAGWRNHERVMVLCGGEAMPDVLRQRFHQTQSVVWNLFGPTETTVWSTVKRLLKDDVSSIGRPIANTRVYVLDKRNRLSPVGVPGELCIAGDGLATGYWGQPELTAEKFIDNPFEPGRKLYRTGDLARWMDNGELDYLGRMDFQVKLNGFRIELDEIETRLNAHPAIGQSVVVLQQRGEVKRLVAFYVPSASAASVVSATELRGFLGEQLPSYMIPSFFVSLQALPLTPNGKVDRRSLMERDIVVGTSSAPKAVVRPDLDSALLEIWREVLAVGGIERSHSFIDLGGNSVSAAILADRIAEKFALPFSVTDLFRYSSIEKIAQHLSELSAAQSTYPDPGAGQSPTAAQVPHASIHQPLQDGIADSLAIIGISCHFPGAKDHRQFWENLLQGKESVTFLRPEQVKDLEGGARWVENPAYVPVALNLEGKDSFDPDFFKISKSNALLMDPQFRQLLLHAWKAVEDAGYSPADMQRAGVFMSASNTLYQSLARRALQHSQVMEQADDYVSWILGQGGSIPTMISYQLGLKGPSVFVHTNCSSSLSALYVAHQALRSGDADYALVGAATLFSSFEAGYIHQPGLNFAGDGHCKAFDAQADGMIAGEGVGVIVVKRAADAIRDQDNIYCLVRGIAINNDGDDKAGFYAPSIDGQAAVIRQVLEKTGVDPQTIRYVEAHGTGTALGDPIEVAALTEVYGRQTEKLQFCGIGSVKPNVGHLDTAAGLAGCVKLAMALRHRRFPAQINYQQPNPRIGFAQSPFYVQQQPHVWGDDDAPMRAALSSFGIGGSNAHAIFEEYRSAPTPRQPGVSMERVVVPLSARTEERLRAYAERWLAFLSNSSLESWDVVDIAYTLQVGRKAMECRVAFVVSSVELLIQALSRFLAKRADAARFESMGAGQEAGPHLQSKDEELIDLWLSQGKLEQLAEAWSQGLPVDWRRLYQDLSPRRLSLPTYPFAEQRYHHRLLLARSDAARDQRHLHPMIHRHTPEGQRYTFYSTFEGSEFFLAEHVLKGRRVLPGVAYLEMALFAAETASRQTVTTLSDVVWMQPVIVDQAGHCVSLKLSTEAGQTRFEVVSEEDASATPRVHSQGYLRTAQGMLTSSQRPLDIGYIRSACDAQLSKERFYALLAALGASYGESFQVIETIWKNDREVLAQLRLPEHCLHDAGSYSLHPSIMDAAFQITDSLILQPGEEGGYLPFFVKRVDVYRKTPINGFAHVRFSKAARPAGAVITYDIDITDQAGQICLSIREFCARKLVKDTFGVADAAVPALHQMLYLTHTWEQELGEPGTQHAAAVSGRTPVIVLAGDDDGRLHGAALSLGCELLHLPTRQGDPERIALERFQFCFDLVQQRFREKAAGRTDLLVIVPEDADSHLYAPLEGLFLTAQREARGFKGRLLTIDALQRQGADAIAAVLGRELREGAGHVHVRYTQALKRQVKRLAELSPQAADTLATLKSDGVYWITGGSGRLAMLLASDLVRRLSVNIVLTGRSPLGGRQRREMDVLRASGSSITYWQADVASRAAMQGIVERIKRQFGVLNGIIHTAGVLRDGLIVNKTSEEIEQVFAPKVGGLVVLDEVTSNEPLDFLALFASVSGVFGAIGQVDYAAANAFVDAFAAHRNALRAQGKRHGKTVAIDWPLWKDGGMQVAPEQQLALFEATGVAALTNESGLDAFYLALAAEQSRIVVLEGDRTRMQQAYLGQHVDPVSHQSRVVEVANASEVQAWLRQQLKSMASEQVQRPADEFDEQTPFGDYGFDSISFTTLSNALNARFKLKPGSPEAITPTVFFEYTTLASLGDHLLDAYGEMLEAAMMEHTAGDDPVRWSQDRSPSIAQEAFAGLASATAAASTPSASVLARDAAKEDARPGLRADDIAIIGVSGKFPMADDLDAFWNNLLEGRDCICEVPSDYWDWRSIYGDPQAGGNKTDRKWGGFMRGAAEFDPLFFGISPRDAEIIDPCHRLLLSYVWTAVEDAGYPSSCLSGSNTSVFIGIGNSGYTDRVAESGLAIDSLTVIGSLSSVAVGRVSHLLNLHGPSEPIDTACSSSLVAINAGVKSILSGQSDLSIVGGVQGMFSPKVHISFSKAGMLAKDGRCKTFSGDADGYVRGEGVGILVLKRLRKAIEDKDHIYGVIKSAVVNHGGKGNSLTSPNPKAQRDLLISALAQADIDPSSVGYVEAHGTGTALGDPIEVGSLKAAFAVATKNAGAVDTQSGYCGLGSVKTNIGHLELAAGVAGVIKVLLQMKHQMLVPSLHCQQVNPLVNLDDSPFYIVRGVRKWERYVRDDGEVQPLRAGVSSFGFGGVNAHVVIEEYVPAPESTAEVTAGPVMIVLSAKYPDRLMAYARDLLGFAEHETANGLASPSGLRALAWTLQTGRDQMKCRLGLVAASVDELKTKLRALLDAGRPTEGVHWGEGAQGLSGQTADAIAQLYAKGDYDAILAQWVGGLTIEWSALYPDEIPQKLHAPTYPFARERYWVTPQSAASPMPAASLADRAKASAEPNDPLRRRELEGLLDALMC